MTNTEYQEELNLVRQELLSREDQYITFGDIVERFDEVEEEYEGEPWNLMQIYNNLNILVGEKPGKDLVSRNADDVIK